LFKFNFKVKFFIQSETYTRVTRGILYKAISHEWGNDLIVITTNETYPWPFVTQILRSGLPSHGGDRNIFEVITRSRKESHDHV
jgi:hypothetical protein